MGKNICDEYCANHGCGRGIGCPAGDVKPPASCSESKNDFEWAELNFGVYVLLALFVLGLIFVYADALRSIH
jgi:hypothetical protein